MKRAGMEERHSPPISGSDVRRSNGKIPASSTADTLKQSSPSRSSVGARVFSRPATDSEPLSGFGPPQDLHDRPVAPLECDEGPSFEFESVDDEQVLAVEASQRHATQASVLAAAVRGEAVQRLAGIATNLQKMMEGDVAFLLKELVSIPAAKNPVSPAVSEARTTFSHFTKHFQNAKLAAWDGEQSHMTNELTLALGKLKSFDINHTAPGASMPLASKAMLSTIRLAVARLESTCRTWAEIANPPAPPLAPSNANAYARMQRIESGARLRSVSSPQPATKKTAIADQPQPDFLGPSSHGKKVADGKIAIDGEKAVSPTATAGRKLRALFAKSGERRIRKDDDGDADNSRRSTRKRADSNAGTENSTSNWLARDLKEGSAGSVLSSPTKLPRPPEKSLAPDS